MSKQLTATQWSFGFFESIFSKRGNMVAPPSAPGDYILRVTKLDNDKQTMDVELHEVDKP